MPNLGLIFRTSIHLKPIQLWFQVWRRIQKKFASHPKCAVEELPKFTFLNMPAKPNGWNDEALELLWRYNLHYLDYPSPTKIPYPDLVSRWIAGNPRGSFPGWDPYPTSLRIVNWIKWLTTNHVAHVAQVEESLKVQTKWLMKHIEYHLLANHILSNAKALVFAGKYFGRRDWYEKGMAIYSKQLPEQTCGDGVNFERSPMYHAIIFEDMLDLAEYTNELLFNDYVGIMADGMRILTGPDGKIAKFNDSTEGIAKPPAELLARADKLKHRSPTIACRLNSTSGFIRKDVGDWVLLAKCGDIGPSYQPGHAHADTYSFELWKSGRKIVSDTGCSTYIPGDIRNYERSTKAHNTVVIDGQNSSEVWASHRVGRRFNRKCHWREFELMDYGLKGVDYLNGNGIHDIEVRFHLPPGMTNSDVTIDCSGELTWEPYNCAVGWNIRKVGLCAVFRQKLKFPSKIEWIIK